MTRKELRALEQETSPKGAIWVYGYCCYQDYGYSQWDLYKIGSNSGELGWNWTVYYCKEKDIFFVSGYRNY